MNPYELLGLSRDADKKAIRAAYRRLAAKYHPDKGGDPEDFARIKLAHDILVDPQRRAKFNSTGDVSETTADNSLSEVLAHLSVALQTVVTTNHERISSVDLLVLMKVHLESQEKAVHADIRLMRSTIEKWVSVTPCFKAKKGKHNFMADICRVTIKQLQTRIGEHEHHAANIAKAREILNEFTYSVKMQQSGFGAGQYRYLSDILQNAQWQKAGL